ncbi:hypothetical protein HPB52_023377 [Rhipicephalus sanguineus]|uniref:THAP-type domain-containing protein n=1 Tax=Rhipicephalus sanguineus TaxID=34632 RepID=A0A9D4T829_RHISA|nr:hypothetical protein HPB52_023377 [Rhipicephalus sanguineus]
MPAQWSGGGRPLPSPFLHDLRLPSLQGALAPHSCLYMLRSVPSIVGIVRYAAMVWNQLGCPARDKMPYCCVPRCKSSNKQRTPGISFHEIPSNPELRAKWLKVVSRDDRTQNTTSCYSIVWSRHCGSSDVKERCKIRKLKKAVVPSIFEEHPAYLQPLKEREREATRLAVESPLETPSLPLNDLPSVDVASKELSLIDCAETQLQLSMENSASERCITATVQVDRAVQVSSLFSVSTMDNRKWRRKEPELNARIERLKNTVNKYKQELQKIKEECYVSAFLQVVEKAKEKDLAASILVEQVQNFAKKPAWSETIEYRLKYRRIIGSSRIVLCVDLWDRIAVT